MPPDLYIPLKKGQNCERLKLSFVKNSTNRSGTSYCFYSNNVRSRSHLFYQPKNCALFSFRSIAVRAFSTSRSDGSSSTDSSGFAVFLDADKDKLNILKYVKGKSGIYM